MDGSASEGPSRAIAAARGSLVGLAAFAALLLIPAGFTPGGTWLWPRGLALIAAYGAVVLTGNVALAVWRPQHQKVREQSVVAPRGRGQPRIDAVGAVALVCFAAAWLAFVPLDVFSLHLLTPPPGPLVSAIGAVAVIVGAALQPLAVWENRFATPNVQDQTSDGQHVIDTGVYGLIRHPIYLGNLLVVGGAALWLGSYPAALIGVGVVLIFTIGRIAVEERELRARLTAYDDYARRVRARLIPFVI
jgi:protein-S-isoprenylcysteine O-methyltransferase Ste14